MQRLSNVRRESAAWLLAPTAIALVAHVLVMAVPHARLDVARTQRDDVLRRADERSEVLRELVQFEMQDGPKVLEVAREQARSLVPEACPALFAQAALDTSLRTAGIQGARADVGGVMPLLEGAGSASLLGRRIDVRGSATLPQILHWQGELDTLAGPLAVLEASFSPATEENAPPNTLEFRIAAQLVHRP